MEAAQKDLSVLQCSYEDEETLTVALGIFKPHIEVDAIRPDVDVALPREVSLCPLPVLRLPDSLQADDVCGGEAGGVGTEECFQCIILHGRILPLLLATGDILRCTGSQQDTPEICPVHKIWL